MIGLFLLPLLLDLAASFPLTNGASYHRLDRTSLPLVPIRNFLQEITFLSQVEGASWNIDGDGRYQGEVINENEDPYELCLVEERDLPDLSRFIVQVFGADVISLISDLNTFERALMQPAVGFMNGYSGLVAFYEVLSGLRSRLADRLEPNIDLSLPDLHGLSRAEKIDSATRKSLVLALAKRSKDSDRQIDVIASIELRLQPCDAKIPFSLPWLDRIERRLASTLGVQRHEARDLQPYLSNLCVDESYRGKRLGKALVRCVEEIAKNSWGYNRMYLHVDLENAPALNLYKNEGYRDVGLRWNPFWAGKAAEIAYFVKNINEGRNTSASNSKPRTETLDESKS